MSDRFDASIKRGHQEVLSNVMGRLHAGSVFSLTPQEYIDLSDLAGALNYWAAQEPETPVAVHAEIPAGDFDRHTWQAAPGVIDAFPFRVPAPPYHSASAPAMKVSVAELGGDPWLRLMTISTVAGDMDASLRSEGKQTTIYLDAGVDFPIGTLLYANVLLLENAPPGKAGSSINIVWP